MRAFLESKGELRLVDRRLQVRQSNCWRPELNSEHTFLQKV
ncbi:hypothetical protein [Paenibacillus rigui]|nr:hypothetical protein [Paenibacillus rigui]